jgi:hypothetical protein
MSPHGGGATGHRRNITVVGVPVADLDLCEMPIHRAALKFLKGGMVRIGDTARSA